MSDIDEMDMLGYFRIRAWKANHEKEKHKPRHRYIDEVWNPLKP